MRASLIASGVSSVAAVVSALADGSGVNGGVPSVAHPDNTNRLAAASAARRGKDITGAFRARHPPHRDYLEDSRNRSKPCALFP